MLRAFDSVDAPDAGIAVGRRIALGFADFIEYHQKLILCLYSVLFILVCEFKSASKLLWYDELATYLPAKLPLSQTLRFFQEGLDVHPVLPSLLVKGMIILAGDNLMTVRLPFILSYLVMCLCIFRFVSRRCPAVYAMAAMLFPTIAATFYYATELRGYAIVMGMTGLAAICWQNAADDHRRSLSIAGLFLSLSIALCSHYYAVFIWIPLGIAEIARTWYRRKFDWPVWAALILSVWPLIVFLPSIRAGHNAYATSMYDKPVVSFSTIGDTYGDLLTLSFVPMVGAVALWLILSRFGRLPSDKPVNAAPAERVLIGTLALMPVYALPLTLLSGAYLSRYVLPAIIGISIFFAFGLARALGRDRLVASVLTVCFFGWFCLKNQKVLRPEIGTSAVKAYAEQAWIRELAGNTLPIAATNTPFFMQLQFYAPPSIRPRVIYPVSRKYATEFDGNDTGDNNMVHFSRLLSIPLADYDAFVAANPRFMLCADTSKATWLVEKLLKDGASLQLRGRDGPIFVYEVYFEPRAALTDSGSK